MKLWKYLVSSALVTLNCPGVELVRDGKPCAEIVISENADAAVKSAAADLQYHLKKISGALIPVVTPAKTNSKNLICVGESECTRKAGYKLPAFKRSGYDMLVKDNLVILAGLEKRAKRISFRLEKKLHPESRFFSLSGQEDDCGAAHAVTAFLEYLGVRFYAPGEDGTLIPQGKNLSVPEFRQTREAAFARRVYRAEALKNDPDTAAWFRHLKCGSSLEPVSALPLAALFEFSPAVSRWVARDALGREQLTDDGCPYPRFSQPGLQREYAEFICRQFDADPSLRQLQLVLPALRGRQDYRDQESWLTKTVYPQPVECDILFSFYSAVAREVGKKHPDRILICQLPMRNTLPSPGILKELPKNLRIQPYGQGATLYSAESTRSQYTGKLDALAKLPGAGTMQQVEWWNEPAFPGVPAQGFWFMHGLQQVRRAQRGVIDGVVMDAGVDHLASGLRLAALPMTQLMYYVNGKLLWDPDLDLQALLDEYYRLWFGPAANEMKSFFLFAENLASRPARRSILAVDGQFRAEDVPVWFELLDRAKAKTSEGSVFRKRIVALESSCADLKKVFDRQQPAVEVQGSVIPLKTVVDGDFSKYRNWTKLPGGKKNVRTEFAVAATEDRQRLFVAFRCYEPDMKRLKKVRLNPDDPALFAGDHVQFSFLTPTKGRYLAAVDPSGNIADGTVDPEDLAFFGCFLGWNPPVYTWTKRYADRWEAEMEINMNYLGRLPDYGPAWEIAVDRCRVSGGETADHSAFAARFTLPKVNSAGKPVSLNYGVSVRHGKVPAESVYTVKRATGPVDLSAEWDSTVWKDVPEIRLLWETVYWKSESKFLPEPRAKIQYDDKYLYVLYQVKDRFVRGTFKNDQNMVCLDSCMEIFIQPFRKQAYYNFECNCIGTLLLYEATPLPNGTNRFAQVPAEELKRIKRFSTLPRDLSGELSGPVVWRLGLQIPLDFFVRRRGVKLPLSGQVWYFNVYKCADWTSNPRWLMWKLTPTFHEPAGFGRMIFE